MRKASAVGLSLCLLLATAVPIPIQAQEGLGIIHESASFTFTKEMAFEIVASTELKEARLFYKAGEGAVEYCFQAETRENIARGQIRSRRSESPLQVRPRIAPSLFLCRD